MLNPTRLTALICLAGVVACGARNAAEPLKDGSWRVQCEDQVEKCVREAQRVCGNDEYHVISGKKEEKLYGGDTGYQTGVELHSLEFRCGSDPAVWKLEREAESAPAKAPAAPPPKQQELCTPGSTQRCVGAGACEGGQSCNAEGTAFLPCDCGAPRPEAPGTDKPEVAPGTAPPAASALPAPTTPPALPLKSPSPGPS